MSDNIPRKVVLERVPRVGYDVHMCPFPGSLYGCLAYLGTPPDYDYIMGVTGAAFRRFWNRDDGGNIDLFYLGDEPARRAFEALGYDWRPVPPERPAMIAAIKESIGRGVPAIAFGIIGPPEAGLVTGYAEDGEVLHGWSYFQEGREAYFERADWFESMERGSHAGLGAIVVGERKETRPAPRQVFMDALRWALDLERTPARPGVPDHAAGLAAYEFWARGLEVDADYPAEDSQVLGVRIMVHGDQTVMLDERANAAGFLRQAAVALPEAADHLRTAAGLYDQVKDCEPHVWHWGESMGPDAQQGLADPATRRGIARAVREAAALEARAVEHIEQALVALAHTE
jgi:hypothetical protein